MSPRPWLLALVAWTGGCGVSADQACQDVANARCARRQACSNGSSVTRAYGDLATCVAREKLVCSDALAARGTGQSAASQEKCASAIAAQSCSDFFLGNPPAVCVATGAFSNASSCAFNSQCSTSYCTNDKNAACGSCGQAPVAGSDCGTSTCARGLSCITTTSATGSSQTCVAEGPQGAACNRNAPCAPGLTCVGITLTASGSCMVAATAAGAACDPTAKTGAGCDRNQGLWCNPQSKSCTAITYVGSGQPCGEGTDGNVSDCSAGAGCYGATFGMMPTLGVCKAPAADGATCDITNGPPCLAPARCVTAMGSTAGTCMVPDASKC